MGHCHWGRAAPKALPQARKLPYKSLQRVRKVAPNDGPQRLGDSAKTQSAPPQDHCTAHLKGGSMLDRSDKGQKFAATYRAEYKRDPLTYAAAFYDGMHLIAAAVEATQSLDVKKVTEHIAA
eukprot:gene41114-50880_t